MNSYMEVLTIDDLDGEVRELAETIGIEAFKKLCYTYSGTSRLYVPKMDMITRKIRDAKIREDRKENTILQLAAKYELSDVHIRNILKGSKSC